MDNLHTDERLAADIHNYCDIEPPVENCATKYCAKEVVECSYCGEMFQREDLIRVAGSLYCRDCFEEGAKK